MKTTLHSYITAAIQSAHADGALASTDFAPIVFDVPKFETHGDFSCNVAMVSAKKQKMPPRQIARALVDHIQDTRGIIERCEIAGPGFINFHLHPHAWLPILQTILEQGRQYGRNDSGAGRKVQVEFVSANPTGPLHVGHGRGAAVGDAVANLLEACGYAVQREYYINDSGRQIQTLGRSVYLRHCQQHQQDVDFPEDCYQGQYIGDLAREMTEQHGQALLEMEPAEAIDICARHAAGKILDGIRTDLENFGVVFDRWFSEQSLYDAQKVEKTIDALRQQDLVYADSGAMWFRSSRYGDEKDRVVVRANGQTTYFASDIAYHHDKYQRGFETVIDVWGADHHGYIPRMTAAIEANGQRREQFAVILVQLVNLLRAGEPVAMSTRAGEFVTLEQVVSEVGRDAARFLFLTRNADSSLDFDLDVAKKQTNENPVYYVQYVHARICSIQRKYERAGNTHPSRWDESIARRLTHPEDIQLLQMMLQYPEMVKSAAQQRAPQRITHFLMDLAAAFHAYYNKHRVLTDDPTTTSARLFLITAIRTVIDNGLTLLGVSAPESM